MSQTKRLALTSAIVAAIGGLPQQAAAASCTWIPASGDWATVGNWSCGEVPDGPSSDTATIGAGRTVSVTTPQSILTLVNGGTVAIGATPFTLQSGGSVNNTGGVITIADGGRFNQVGGAITGGTITTTGSGALVAYSNGNNILSGVTLNGTLDMATVANARQRIANGLTLNGAVNVANGGFLYLDANSTTGGNQTIAGNGTIHLNATDSRLTVEGNGTTTLATGITVRGQGNVGQAILSGGNNTLVNNGTISADIAGGTLTLSPPGNAGSVVNNGTLQALNGATLQLDSNVQGNAGSQISAGAGSRVVQNGVRISGLVTTSGSGVFTAASSGNNILDGVTLTGTLDLGNLANARERIVNGLTLNGNINVANGGFLSLDGNGTTGNNQTIGGTGTINLNDANVRLTVEGSGTTTLASGITVRGQGNIGQGIISGGNTTLVNNGTISADIAGGTLTLSPPGNGSSSIVVNNGTLRALNGGTLQLDSNIQGNAGSQISAGAGSRVVQNGVRISGLVTTSGSGLFTVASNGNNVLDGVTLNGTLDLGNLANARERIVNGLTLNGNINVANGGFLSLDGNGTTGNNQTIGGNGTIHLNDANVRLTVEGSGTTTLASGITVRGQGNIGQGIISGGNTTLVNNGTISADIAGGTLELSPPGNGSGSFVLNNNVLQATGGGTLLVSSNVANGSGTIRAQDGSAVVLNGVRVTGGVLDSAGTGTVRAASNGNNVLSGVTVAGVLDLTAIANGRMRIVDGATINGSVNVGNGGFLYLDAANTPGNAQTIGGTGTIHLNAADSRLTIEGSGSTTLASGLTVRGQGNIGQALVSGGNHTLVNNGTIRADGGTLAITAPANGSGSTLAGTGTLQVAGGTLNLATGNNSVQGTLAVGATGSLNLNDRNLTLGTDYTNAQSGAGNAFDRRAGVSGTGQILAGGNAAQVVTGSGVSNGASTNATLTLGNVRVGTTTAEYQITNAGTTGPTLRGAIQTNVNGANLTDARLGGTGVTASNYNAGAPGGTSGSLAVTFTASSAGVLAPLVGQSVNLRSNFENIADQKLAIVLGNDAAAYQTAAGAIQSAPLNFGTVQVGQVVTQNLVVRNTATGPSGFVEDLNASFGAASGTGASRISGSGSLNGIIAGANSTGANGTMSVSVDTSSAGVVNGGIAVNYATAGAVNGVSNGLGTASVGGETYGVAGTIQAQANVINQASPRVDTPSITLAARVGAAAPTQAVSVTNVATASPQAALNASIASNGAPITAGGSFALLAPGATNNGSLVVGLQTATAGTFNGGATLNLVSDASNVGNCAPNCQMTLASQQVTVNGKVYAPAVAQLNTPVVDFGIVHVGDAVAARAVSVTNAAAVAGLNDTLTGTFAGATGPFSATGSLGGVAAQATNATSFLAGLSTATAGVFAGSASATFASHDPDLADLALGTSAVTLRGQVNNYAQVGLQKTGGSGTLAQAGNTWTIDFGDLLLGSGNLTQTLDLFNAANGPADLLRGSFDLSGAGSPFTLGGFASFAGLAAGDAAGGYSVTFDGSMLGSFSGFVLLNATGSNASGYEGALAGVRIDLRGNVVGIAAPIPEPETYALMLAGLAALGFVARRRAATAA